MQTTSSSARQDSQTSETRRPVSPTFATAAWRVTDASRGAVWVAHASASMAAEVAERLSGLDFDVLLWNPDSPQPEAGGVVVADAISLQRMARDLHRDGVKREPATAWRGGLAPGVLRRVKERIECALADKIELADLAKVAGLSECHFSRAFAQSMGLPPHRYIVSRRIDVASRLIQQTHRSLTDIALAVGFSDHSHFTRSFVRMTGETPSAHRHRHR